MQRNVAGQVTGAQMRALDGTAFTGVVTVYVTGAGTQTLGATASGIAVAEGNGLFNYSPTQAETNYDFVQFTFVGPGAGPVTVKEYTKVDANVTTSNGDPVTNYDGIAQAGTATSITLEAGEVATDNYWANQNIEFVEGPGKGGKTTIVSNVGLVCALADTMLVAPGAGTKYSRSCAGANLVAVNGKTRGVAAFERAINTIIRGTVGAGSTVSSIVTSSLSPTPTTANQFKGRVILFEEDTVTAALRGQGTDIAASTVGGVLTPSPTTPLTTAPANGDSFVIQ